MKQKITVRHFAEILGRIAADDLKGFVSYVQSYNLDLNDLTGHKFSRDMDAQQVTLIGYLIKQYKEHFVEAAVGLGAHANQNALVALVEGSLNVDAFQAVLASFEVQMFTIDRAITDKIKARGKVPSYKGGYVDELVAEIDAHNAAIARVLASAGAAASSSSASAAVSSSSSAAAVSSANPASATGTTTKRQLRVMQASAQRYGVPSSSSSSSAAQPAATEDDRTKRARVVDAAHVTPTQALVVPSAPPVASSAAAVTVGSILAAASAATAQAASIAQLRERITALTQRDQLVKDKQELVQKEFVTVLQVFERLEHNIKSYIWLLMVRDRLKRQMIRFLEDFKKSSRFRGSIEELHKAEDPTSEALYDGAKKQLNARKAIFLSTLQSIMNMAPSKSTASEVPQALLEQYRGEDPLYLKVAMELTVPQPTVTGSEWDSIAGLQKVLDQCLQSFRTSMQTIAKAIVENKDELLKIISNIEPLCVAYKEARSKMHDALPKFYESIKGSFASSRSIEAEFCQQYPGAYAEIKKAQKAAFDKSASIQGHLDTAFQYIYHREATVATPKTQLVTYGSSTTSAASSSSASASAAAAPQLPTPSGLRLA